MRKTSLSHREYHLAYYLTRRQPPLEPHRRGETEDAAAGAPGLRRNANGRAALQRDEHRLDALSIGKYQTQLGGATGRDIAALDEKVGGGRLRSEPRADGP